jgi:L-serine dehydratase
MEFEFIPETANVEHPNTARVVIGDDESEMSMMGISIGGGKIETLVLKRYG